MLRPQTASSGQESEPSGEATHRVTRTDAELLKAATEPDHDARLQALRVLVAEETRMGMMIGVAVGWELARELEQGPQED